MTSVMWFRRDLRLADLPALKAAIEAGPVAALFVFDERLIHGRWPSPNRVAFMLGCLRKLDEALKERGTRLHIRIGPPEREVLEFARESGAGQVFVSRDYSPLARKRDGAVARALDTAGIEFHARRGTLIHEPEEVRSQDDAPYSVYSPFSRRWNSLERRPIVPAPGKIAGVESLECGQLPKLASLGFEPPAAELLQAGEAAAEKRLQAFCDDGLEGYGERRNLLAEDGTSRLSQDLKWGTLSPLAVVAAAEAAIADASKFVSEVAWRDFYYHVLWNHPRVVREPFREEFATLRWETSPALFDAWTEGRTGFPLIDAAMRQLLATGFMHNRARMVVASFLAKDLHLDWRLGEAHFMRYLADGDLASNNGGWQWAASTGTDPQPYFRIFNPTLQAERFDPHGVYVRRWVPELAKVPGKFVHEPWKMTPEQQRAASCLIGKDYPAPVVDHATERKRAIAMYSETKEIATGSG